MKVEITDIQYGCTHDGPGIRTTVFLKGCPLHCRWCHNPEAIKPGKQLFFREFKCIGCGRCVEVCEHGAHMLMENGAHVFYPDQCTACMKCTEPFVCPAQAVTKASYSAETTEVIEKVCRDKAFYREHGGVTFSGGEPTFQRQAFLELLQLAKKEGLSVCVETCGAFDAKMAEELAGYTDLVLFDVKDTNPKRHLNNTGYPLEPILASLARLDGLGVPTLLRCIMIPSENMVPEHAEALSELYHSLNHCQGIELLPYHNYGLSKGVYLSAVEKWEAFDVPEKEALENFTELLKKSGTPVRCLALE